MCLACALLLCGCVSPKKLKETQQSIQTFEQQKAANYANQRCDDAGAIPGSMQHFQCMLGTPPQPASAASP